MKTRKLTTLILVLAIITLTSASLLTACTAETPDMSGISFESKSYVYDGLEHELVIKGTLPEGVTVSYENNKLTDVGTVEATAKFTHKNSKVVIPDMKATLTVTPATGDIGKATFKNKTVIYDGTEHELTVQGELPEGVTVTYENNKLTNVGTVEAVAHFRHENSNIIIPDAKATLTVIPADGSLGTATFTDKTVEYDGTEHELTVEGTLPDGVSVSYTANKLTMPGSIEVTASFTSENPNYTFKDIKATLTVTKVVLSPEEIGLVQSEFVYNGNPHSVSLDLPDYIKYTIINGEATDAGEYTCLVQFDKETVDAEDTTLDWIITKADIDEEILKNVKFDSKTLVYDGSEHSLAVEGAEVLPEGSSISYSAGNKLTKPGTVSVTATIRNDNYNDVILTATLTINKAVIDMSSVTFDDAVFEYDGQEKQITANGIPENVDVKYIGNGQKNAGVHTVTANFSVKENADCYELSMNSDTATITINKKHVQIHTVEELQAINDTVSDSANYTYELANNIDGSQAVDQEKLFDGKFRWTGIGSFTNPFRSSLEGNGYTISNLYIDVNSGVFEAGQYFIGIFNVVSTNAADNLWIQNVNVSNITLDINTDGKLATVGTLIGRIGIGNNETIGIDKVNISDSTMKINASRAHAGTAIGWSCGNKGVQIKNVAVKNVDITADVTTRADIGGFVGNIEYKTNYYVDCSVDENCDININMLDNTKGVLKIGGFASSFEAAANDIELFITRCSSAAKINVTTPEGYEGTFLAGKILANSSNAGGDILGQTYILINFFDNGNSYTNMEEFGWTGSFKVNSVEKEDLVYYTAAGVAYAESNNK